MQFWFKELYIDQVLWQLALIRICLECTSYFFFELLSRCDEFNFLGFEFHSVMQHLDPDSLPFCCLIDSGVLPVVSSRFHAIHVFCTKKTFPCPVFFRTIEKIEKIHNQ